MLNIQLPFGVHYIHTSLPQTNAPKNVSFLWTLNGTQESGEITQTKSMFT